MNPLLPLSVALMLATTACTAQSPAAATASPDGGVRGTVAVVGSAPVSTQVVLRTEDGRNLAVGGSLEAEVARLTGVVVDLFGTIGRAPDPMSDGRIDVQSYRIVSVDGEPAISGEIVSLTNGTARLRTDDGETVVLFAVPSTFRVGQRVWIQGSAGMAVQSFGVIRP